MAEQRKPIGAQIKISFWQELNAFRESKKWSWTTLLEESLATYMAAEKAKESTAGKKQS